MKRVILATVLLLFSLTAFGADRIVGIEVTGVHKTNPRVVINISGLQIGEELDIEKVYRAKRNLEDCGLFTDVYLQLNDADGDYKLIISVQERNTIYPYFGEYLALGVGDKSFLGSGVNLYGGIRFLRFTDEKLLGVLPKPQFFWGGLTLGASTFSAFGSGLDPFLELTLFREVPWRDDLILTLDSFSAGTTYSFEDLVVGISYTYEKATFDTTPLNNYSLSILSGAFAFGDEENYEEKRGNFYGQTALSYGFGKGINYLNQKASFTYWYRIIGRIYVQSDTMAGLTYFGQAPVTKQFYLGGNLDLKGWEPYSFNPRFFLLEILEAGIPLTESFGISPSDEMSVFIPKLYLMGALGDNETLGMSIGIGFEWKTPLGVAVEPQLFFGGSGLKFYLELN